MVGEVLEPRLHPPIIFASHEQESVRCLDLGGERFHRLGCLTLGIFLVHPVEHRKVDRHRIDQFGIAAARVQPAGRVSPGGFRLQMQLLQLV